AIEANHGGQADGGVVVGPLQGVAGCNLAVELAFKVARRVLVGSSFAVGSLLVAEDGDGREQLCLARQHRAFGGGLKSSSVDKRLEDGAGGPMRDDVVDLTVAVAAAAD